MKKKPMVTVVIPAYNEQKTIRKMVNNVRPYSDEILVVLSKKSKDRTRYIVKKMGVPFILDNGKGKGEALRCAIKHVKKGIIVFIDADGSHLPADIPRLVEHLVNNNYDMVIGSRMTGGSDELHGNLQEFVRLMFSSIITLIINYRFGANVTDYQNGFRAIKANVAKKLRLREDITTIEQEMGIKCLKKGYTISEVPTHEYAGGRSSFTLWEVGFRYFWQILRDIW